jgi:peptide/nickel transport system substrate-binding protein
MTGLRLLACVVVAAALLTVWPAQAQDQGNTAERVRIAWPRDDGTLTPYTFGRGYPLMTLVYDTLLWRDEGGSAEEWLARQIRTTEAGRRVTVALRDGARFHDGRPLTAEDVKFSYDYFAERYQSRFTPQLQAIESVEVVDELTVAFNLEYASPGFNLPLSDVPILPRHLWEGLPRGETPPGKPVGSGPYRLVERSPEERYVFRANDDYFLGQPRVATLELPFDSDFAGTVGSLLNRDVDMIPRTLSQGTQEDVTGPGFRIERGQLYTGTALTFNVRKPPFDSVRARRAISRALDLERITNAAVGPSERTFQADRGYLHPRSASAAEGPLQRFDRERARAELSALDLPRIKVLADDDPVSNLAGQQVVLALTRAGADAELVTMRPGELSAAVDPDDGTPTFAAAILSTSPLASYSPDYLSVVFGSDERRAPLNFSGYSSEEFDRLAASAARETNPRERSQTIRSELRLLAQEDVPVVPLFYPEGAFVYRDNIYKGWIYIEGTGLLDKRSFLPRNISAEEGAGPNAAPVDPAGGSGGGIGALGVVALGILGIAVIVVLIGAVRRRP